MVRGLVLLAEETKFANTCLSAGVGNVLRLPVEKEGVDGRVRCRARGRCMSPEVGLGEGNGKGRVCRKV